MKRFFFCGCIASRLLSSVAFATPTVVVGNRVLAPGLAGQPVQLSVTGGDAVQGVDFNAEVADGGPTGGGTISGPHITGVNLISGTIFASNNSGQQDITTLAQVYAGGIATSNGTVAANGLLATMTFDTTGFTTPNTAFALRLKGFSSGIFSGDSDFGDSSGNILPGNITNGNLIIGYAGDLNLDGTVNFSDLLTLAQNYGHTGASYFQGDLDHNGTVNFADLLTLAQNYGKSVNTSLPAPAVALSVSSVPEPASLGLLAGAAAFLCRRSRRSR